MSDVTTSTYTNSSTGVKEFMDAVYEDKEGIIQMISPSKTPFIASIGTGTAKSTNHQWLEDELKAATSNAAIEGADAVSTVRTPPSLLSNYTQIIEDTFKLSGSALAVDNIGRKKLERYEADKSLKYINLCIEYAALNNSAYNAGAAGTARQMKGLEGFVATNDKSYGSYAASNDFSEAKFLDMGQAVFDAGGDPDILLVPSAQARKIGAWNQNSRITVNTNASEKALVMAVMVLETPFGRVKVTISRHTAQDTDSGSKYDRVYLYDSTRFSLATLRPFKAAELARTGDSFKYQSIWEGTLVCHNEQAAAKCKKCATD